MSELRAAFIVLGFAVLLGATLAVLHLRTPTGAAATSSIAPWPVAALHGLLGIGGLICLVLALRGPPRGLDQGTAGFGAIAATLIALAALAAGGILAARLRNRRPAAALIGVHAALAVSGFVILAAYALVG